MMWRKWCWLNIVYLWSRKWQNVTFFHRDNTFAEGVILCENVWAWADDHQLFDMVITGQNEATKVLVDLVYVRRHQSLEPYSQKLLSIGRIWESINIYPFENIYLSQLMWCHHTTWMYTDYMYVVDPGMYKQVKHTYACMMSSVLL